MRFGEKLKKLRKGKGYTQQAVAKACGLTTRAYIAYEQKNVRPRNRETYTKLADKFDCDVNYLLMDDTAAIKGTTVAIAAFASLLGPFAIAGMPILLSAGPAILGSLTSTRFNENTEDTSPEVLTYNNDLLLQYDKRQKQFRAAATGILISKLAFKGIACQLGTNNELDKLGGLPDAYLILNGQNIDSWWFSFWAKDKKLDENVVISVKDQANIMICRYTGLQADPMRKVSIVVDDEELFEALCAYKGHNSYRGNLTAILLDIENCDINKEIVISSYNENDEDSLVSLLSE